MKKRCVFVAILLTLLMVLNLGVNVRNESITVTGNSAYAVTKEKKEAKCIVCSNGIKIECIEGGIGSCNPITDCVAGTCGES